MIVRISKLEAQAEGNSAKPIQLSALMLGVITYMQKGAILFGFKGESAAWADCAGLEIPGYMGHSHHETISTSTVSALLRRGAIEIEKRDGPRLTYAVTDRMRTELQDATL